MLCGIPRTRGTRGVSFNACFGRSSNLLQVAVLSIITGAFFWKHRLHQNTLADGQEYGGLLCKGLNSLLQQPFISSLALAPAVLLTLLKPVRNDYHPLQESNQILTKRGESLCLNLSLLVQSMRHFSASSMVSLVSEVSQWESKLSSNVTSSWPT